MEQFVLGIFQEHLSRFIIGFRKEQVNTNLLNGKGEINNVELNCAVLNETIHKMTPYVELERVHVSKLSFHVTSWTNLRKAPIMIDIEHVHAVAVEPLHYTDRSARRRIQQIMHSELLQMVCDGLLPRTTTNRGPYNIFDRILDNLTIEIQTVRLDYQPWGKFKTRREGPWTPPQLQIRLAGIRLASVNEYGQEGPPEEVWKHNHHQNQNSIKKGDKNHRDLLVYKRLVMEYQIFLRPVGETKSIPLVSGKENKVELQFAVQRRIRDGEWLALQLDATIPRVAVDIPAHVVPLLAQAVAGLAFCLAKDRGFDDPLKQSSSENVETEVATIEVTVSSSDSFDETENSMSVDECATGDMLAELNVNDSSSEDEEEVETKSSATGETSQPASLTPSRASSVVSSLDFDRPVILLPNGMVIHEKICLSVSIHHVSIRGTYATDGYVEMEARGCVTEIIWPKVNMDKGGYVQLSVSYMSLHEQNCSRIRPLMIGGVQYDSSGPLEQPGKPLGEVSRDETFPLYEDRPVRPDPTGLRYKFPAQAFGAKTTIEFIPKISKDDENEENILFLNEIGIDQVEVVADAHAWRRINRFALNVDGGGFDSRWSSGDWGELLTQGMLLRPSEPLRLEDHLQTTKVIFLDGNEFVSSDLFNVTARFTNVGLRIPAALKEDLRSCDILTNLGEAMLMVSSALPRTFLSGNIGTAVNGNDSTKKGLIDFPNDPLDAACLLERSEDPSDRQRGVTSTFRMQLTLRDYSIRLEPVIAFCIAEEPRQLVAPSELTLLLCMEGEPPEDPEGNHIKMSLFVSALVHRFHLNLDLDLISAAIGTLTHHGSALLPNECRYPRSPGSEASESEYSEHSTEDAIPDGSFRMSLRGSRARIERHFHRSRESGGLSFALAVQVAESGFCFWRQNIPVRSPFRRALASNTESSSARDEVNLPMLKVCAFEVMGLEARVEATFQNSSRRIVAKMCLSSANFQACDLTTGEDLTSGLVIDGECISLVDIFRLGRDSKSAVGGLRVEEQRDSSSRTWSLSVDAGEGVVVGRVREFEATVLLILEALLMPTSSKNYIAFRRVHPGLFPEGTVGALIRSLVPSGTSLYDTGFLDSIAKTWKQTKSEIASGQLPPEKAITTLLRGVIQNFVPMDVTCSLVRITVNNLLLQLIGPGDLKDFGCFFHSLEFLASYLSRDLHSCGLLNVVSRPGKKWSDVLESREKGLWHRLDSRQSLMLVVTGADTNRNREMVVDEFRLVCEYEGGRLSLSMAEGPSIEKIERLEEFFVCLFKFVLRCKQSVTTALRVVNALRQTNFDRPARDAVELAGESPVALAASGTGVLMRYVAELLRKLTCRMDDFIDSTQTQLRAKQEQIDMLKVLVFLKEKERLGALGLVSATIAGWLRFGAAQRTGQRGLLSCTLWPQWLVLRRCVLIVYSNPGSCEAISVISLQNASLRQLAGGPRKRDLKRAFALIDSAGTIHFLIAGSDREYYNWVRQVQVAINFCSPGNGKDSDISESYNSESLDRSRHSMTDSIMNRSGHGRQLGQSISRAVMAAKATGRAVVDRGRRRNEQPRHVEIVVTDTANPSADDDSQNEGGQLTPGKQLKNRFAGVGQVTRSRFGSAFQAAKQKGKDVADRRRRSRSNQEGNVDAEVYFTADAGSVDTAVETPSGLPAENRTNLETPVSDGGSFSGSHTEEDGGPGRRIRERLGTAVRNVTRGAQTMGEDNSLPPGEAEKGRFTLRLRKTEDRPDTVSSSMGDADAVRLRHMSIAGPLVPPVDPISGAMPEEPEIPLKKLEGIWFVKVALSLKVIKGNPAIEDNQDSTAAELSESPIDVPADLDVVMPPAKVGRDEDAHPPISLQPNGGSEGQLGRVDTNNENLLGPKPVFEIRVFRSDKGGSGSTVLAELERIIPEVLALHSSLSESVAPLASGPFVTSEIARASSGEMSNSLASALGLNALETTRLTGNLLGDLVATALNDDFVMRRNLAADLVAEFLNSMLDCPLPIEGLAQLTDFLEITDVSTNDIPQESTTRVVSSDKDIAPKPHLAKEIHSLLASCETGVLRAENQNYLTEKLSSSSFCSRLSDVLEIPRTLFTSSPSSSHYQDAIHTALMKVMAERDDAHARMVAADVLHVHEFEQQRNKISQLAAQLDAQSEAGQDSTSAPPAQQNEAVKTMKLMQQDSDAELVALCQQLSTEISGRTSAALELTRLKEVCQIEQETEMNEKKALQFEIEQLKELLAKEKKKTKEARRESGTWKKSFQEAVQASRENMPVVSSVRKDIV